MYDPDLLARQHHACNKLRGLLVLAWLRRIDPYDAKHAVADIYSDWDFHLFFSLPDGGLNLWQTSSRGLPARKDPARPNI